MHVSTDNVSSSSVLRSGPRALPFLPGSVPAVLPAVIRQCTDVLHVFLQQKDTDTSNQCPLQAEETRERGTDDNPAEQAAKDFEKNVVDPFVKKTQENSGLDANVFNKTADSASKDDVGAFADTMSFAGLAPEIINGRCKTP